MGLTGKYYKSIFDIFGIIGSGFKRAKFGQVGCPWKDLAKRVDLVSIGPPSQLQKILNQDYYYMSILFDSGDPFC